MQEVGHGTLKWTFMVRWDCETCIKLPVSSVHFLPAQYLTSYIHCRLRVHRMYLFRELHSIFLAKLTHKPQSCTNIINWIFCGIVQFIKMVICHLADLRLYWRVCGLCQYQVSFCIPFDLVSTSFALFLAYLYRCYLEQ